MMKYIYLVLFVSYLNNVAFAFELDGLKSGMSMEQAKEALGKISYSKISEIETSLIATDESPESHRMISASFCKGKLVQVSKHLSPHFDQFVRLVEQKSNEYGNHVSSWVRSPNAESGFKNNSVSFLWRTKATSITATYNEFTSNKQLSILYADRNSCWKID